MKSEQLMELVEAYRMSGGREEHHARKEHLMCAFQEIELEAKKLREQAQIEQTYNQQRSNEIKQTGRPPHATRSPVIALKTRGPKPAIRSLTSVVTSAPKELDFARSGIRSDIAVDLSRLCARNKEGSFATQADRAQILHQAARTLQKAGFQNLAATSLKPKHVDVLLKSWQADGLSVGTIKNRMACVRWWAEKVNKQNCVPRTNDELGIERRSYVATESKAQTLDTVAVDKLIHERLKVSLQLQEAFGLRREESLKFQPVFATQGLSDSIRLKASWCQGGRPRTIPITSEHQRTVLAKAHALAGSGSMIPPEKMYVTWLRTYEEATRVIGARKLHGLRHGFAQLRFEALAGFKAPVAGGPIRADLSPEQSMADANAREQVANELFGPGRKDVIAATAVYLGR